MDFLAYQSIPAILKDNSIRYRDRTAISYKKSGVYLSLNYDEFYTRVLQLSRGLCKAGMQPGDKVAIFSENRLGWAISDFGIQSGRGIPVPIYATNTGEQAAREYLENYRLPTDRFSDVKEKLADMLEFLR